MPRKYTKTSKDATKKSTNSLAKKLALALNELSPTTIKDTSSYFCEFCKCTYARELTFINHKCEKKRRWLMRDDLEARLAFMAWHRFYELNGSHGKKPMVRDFIDSKYYTSFIKYARYLIDLNVIDTAEYTDYVIKNNLPLPKWIEDATYIKFVYNFLKNESPESALYRNIELMQNWSKQNDEPWYDFFRKVSPTQATAWIMSGRISPWVLFNTDSAEILLNRCGPEQINLIQQYTIPNIWKIKFDRDKDGADWIRNTLRSAGL